MQKHFFFFTRKLLLNQNNQTSLSLLHQIAIDRRHDQLTPFISNPNTYIETETQPKQLK